MLIKQTLKEVLGDTKDQKENNERFEINEISCNDNNGNYKCQNLRAIKIHSSFSRFRFLILP